MLSIREIVKEKNLEAQAGQGDAAAAEAFARGQKSKTRRAAIVTAAALAVTGTGMYSCHEVVKQFKGTVPQEDIQAKIQSQLDKVSLPNKAILVEGTGNGSAKINVRYKLDTPVIRTLFNHTIASHTDMSASAQRAGAIQIVSENNAIRLSATKAPDPKSGRSNWAIKADVAADLLSSQTANMRTTALTSSADFLSFATVQGVTKRVGWVTQWADRSFLNNCGRALTPDISAGVSKFVRSQVTSTADIEQSLGHASDAKLLRSLARQPPVVTFNAPDAVAGGSLAPHEIAASQVKLPTTFVPSGASMAHELGKSPDDVHLDTGAQDCSFTGDALRQQMQILGKGPPPAV